MKAFFRKISFFRRIALFRGLASFNPSKFSGMNWDLSFCNKEWEEIYQKSKEKYSISLMKVILFFILMLGIIQIALEPYPDEIDLTKKIIFYVIINTIILIPLVIANYKKNYSEILLAIDVTLAIIAALENFQARKKFNDPVFYFTYGSFFSALIFFLIIGRVSWKYFAIIISGTCCLLNLRYLNVEEEKNLNFPLAHIICICLIFFIICILMEYNERDRFRKIRKFEISLIQFKYILKDVFPSSVFVARDENLLFQNTILEQNFCDLLGGIPFNLTQIKNILVDQKQYPLDQNFTAIKNEEQLLLNTRDAPPLNLYNFLKFTEMDDLIPNNFINLHGNLPIVRNGEKDQIFLDIKIGSILWEGEKALLVILDENKIIKRYRELNEQSIYKDKLLATVSHDLRTPLNGVIGILKLILENTEDRQKRKR